MKNYKIYLFVSCVFILFSCSKKEKNEPETPTVLEIHVLGGGEGVSNATYYWKNGDLVTSFDQPDAPAFGMDVDKDGNGYVAGYQKSESSGRYDYYGAVWKNGDLQYKIEDGNSMVFCNDILIDREGNTFVTGSDGDVLKVWKNGQVLYASSKGKNLSVSGMAFDKNGDVYIGGMNNNQATVWKNGDIYKVLTEAGGWDIAVDMVFDSKGDLYIAGYEKDQQSDVRYATIWKDGDVYKRLNSADRDASASAIVVDHQDNLYVAGVEENENGEDIATIWKNGEVYQTIPSNSSKYASSSANDMVIDKENNIYVVGGVRNPNLFSGVGKVWRNGKEIFTLTGDDAIVWAHKLLLYEK